MMVILIVKKGILGNKERIFTRYFYIAFIGAAFIISVLTDFFN